MHECPNIFVLTNLTRTNVRIYSQMKDWYERISEYIFVTNIFEYIRHTLIQKCLETGKQKIALKKSLFSRDFVVSPVSGHFPYSRNLVVSDVSQKVGRLKSWMAGWLDGWS